MASTHERIRQDVYDLIANYEHPPVPLAARHQIAESLAKATALYEEALALYQEVESHDFRPYEEVMGAAMAVTSHFSLLMAAVDFSIDKEGDKQYPETLQNLLVGLTSVTDLLKSVGQDGVRLDSLYFEEQLQDLAIEVTPLRIYRTYVDLQCPLGYEVGLTEKGRAYPFYKNLVIGEETKQFLIAIDELGIADQFAWSEFAWGDISAPDSLHPNLQQLKGMIAIYSVARESDQAQLAVEMQQAVWVDED